MIKASLLLGLGYAGAEYMSCNRAQGEWVGIDQVGSARCPRLPFFCAPRH